MTDNELALLASQRLPGFDAVRVIASELREARHVSRSPTLFDPIDDEEYDAECGLTCAGE
jgi:hypothetical protein